MKDETKIDSMEKLFCVDNDGGGDDGGNDAEWLISCG